VVSTRHSAGIVGTPTTLYSTSNYANTMGFGPDLMRSNRTAGGTSWTADTPPSAMNNGWIAAAVVNDGTRWIVVSGNWNAGLWRYAEP
jgi:hypothetical protein